MNFIDGYKIVVEIGKSKGIQDIKNCIIVRDI